MAAEDFVLDDQLEATLAQVRLRSLREAAERAAQLHRDEELDELFLHQGLEQDRAAAEKKAFWEAYAQAVVDLVSDSDDE